MHDGRFDNPQIDWSVYSGSFIVKADGSPNCYFLGPPAGLPGNIPIFEFSLTITPGVEVKEVRFSSQGVEYVSQNCPWPELEKEIQDAYKESRSSPQDESKSGRFLKSLEKALPEVDCVRTDGWIGPAPAWTLADLDVVLDWVRYLNEKMEEDNGLALRVFAGIYNRASGIIGEVMADLIWQILHDRPLFILENWDAIKNYRKTILESRWLGSWNSNIEMPYIYRDIAIKEPKYKSACNEIISILGKKSQAERSARHPANRLLISPHLNRNSNIAFSTASGCSIQAKCPQRSSQTRRLPLSSLWFSRATDAGRL